MNKRDELYQLAAYELETTRLTPRATSSWFYFGGAAVIAVVAMALFTLVIGPGSLSDDKAEKSTETPTGGLLVKTPGAAGLWVKLGLKDCEDRQGQVPVFVLSESDTEYHVQTIGLPGTDAPATSSAFRADSST